MDPLDELATIDPGDDIAAARLRLEWRHALATETGMPEDQREELHAALRELDRRFPAAHHEMTHASERELGGFTRGLRAHRDYEREEAGVTSADAARHRERRNRAESREHEAGRRGGARSPSRRGSGARRPAARHGGSGVYRTASDRLGVTQAAGTATDLIFGALRIGLALAAGYFVLTPQGSKALSGLLTGVGDAFALVVEPVDPLAGPTALRKLNAQRTAQVRRVAPTATGVTATAAATAARLASNAQRRSPHPTTTPVRARARTHP